MSKRSRVPKKPKTTARRGPRFTALHSTDLDREANDVVMRFVSDEGLQFTMRLHRGIIGSLVATLLAQVAKLPKDPRGADVQALTLTSCQKAFGPQGQPMLALQFDRSLEIAAVLPPGSIPILRNSLAELDALTAGLNQNQPRH